VLAWSQVYHTERPRHLFAQHDRRDAARRAGLSVKQTPILQLQHKKQHATCKAASYNRTLLHLPDNSATNPARLARLFQTELGYAWAGNLQSQSSVHAHK